MADVGVGDGVEHHGEGVAVGVHGHLDLAVAGEDGAGTVDGRGTDLDEVVGEAVDADAGDGRAAQHRELDLVLHLDGEGVLELGHGRDVVGEEALEQVVVAGDDLLDDRVVDLVLLGLQVVGHRRAVSRLLAVVEVGRLGEDVDDAVEVGLVADGELEDGEAAAEAVAQAAAGRRRSRSARGRAC